MKYMIANLSTRISQQIQIHHHKSRGGTWQREAKAIIGQTEHQTETASFSQGASRILCTFRLFHPSPLSQTHDIIIVVTFQPPSKQSHLAIPVQKTAKLGSLLLLVYKVRTFWIRNKGQGRVITTPDFAAKLSALRHCPQFQYLDMATAIARRNSPRIGRPSSRTASPMDSKKTTLKSEG